MLDPEPYFIRNYGTKGRTSDAGVKQAVGPGAWAWVIQTLRALGWPVNERSPDRLVFDAVQCFQEGYGLTDRLTVDRFPGEMTRSAMRRSLQAGGMAFENFGWREVWDWRKQWPRLRYELGEPCQRIRTQKGRAYSAASWFRTISSNRAAGSTSTASRHIYAEACDPQSTFNMTLEEAVGLQAFSGLGVIGPGVGWGSIVVHNDVGGLCDKGSNRRNRTGGVADPMVWPYDPRTGRALAGQYLSGWGI